MSVRAAVERDLKDIASRDKGLARSGLAELALVLADMIDDRENSATSRSMCSRSLVEALDRLRELAPPVVEEDRLDELSRRREKRVSTA